MLRPYMADEYMPSVILHLGQINVDLKDQWTYNDVAGFLNIFTLGTRA